MLTQLGDTSGDLLETLEQATEHTKQLDGKLTQLTQMLKARGLLFSDELLTLVHILRETLRIAYRSARQAERKVDQMQKLVDTSAVLTSSLELDRVLEHVVDTVVKLTGAERVYLMLRDEASGELKIRAARNWDKADLDKEEMSFSRGIVHNAIEKGEPVLTTNAQMDERFQELESVVSKALRSIACVPFALRGKAIGALYADHRIKAGMFGADIIPALTAFANQAAIAIENARLFEQVRADLDDAQDQLQSLRIQLDRQQSSTQIDEIVDSEFFKRLARRDDLPSDG
jgi:adenylate cyclase